MKFKNLKIKSLLLVCLMAVFFLTGCLSFGTHPKGLMPSAYEMKNKNYEVIESSEGQSSSFKLFWIFPVTDEAALKRAMDSAIYEKGGDNLINVRLWHERQYWILGTIDVLYVEGDVIRYEE